MKTPHDLGGREGFGAVPRETDETQVFAQPWHARALALTVAAGSIGAWNIDASRHSRECLGEDYTDYSYYERWLGGLARLLVERGIATPDEIAKGKMIDALPSDATWRPLEAARAKQALRAGGPSLRDSNEAPRFAIGQKVKTRALADGGPMQVGHTRLPAYAAERTGSILLDHGAHVLPDSNAHFKGEAPEPLYCVSFSAREEQASPADEIRLDLWQSYLVPA